MDKGKNYNLKEEKKNKNHSKNNASEKFNEDLTNNKQDNSKKNEEEYKKEELTSDEKLLNEVTFLKEEKLRLLAEMENLRKRFGKEKIELIKYGSINLIREILSPGDNLERALIAIPTDEKLSQSISNLIDGLKMVQREFTTILEKNGVKKIDSLNKKFDHNYHQAIMEIEKKDVEAGKVVQEIQSGYMMHDRLLRPAMVGVSKKPITGKTKKTKEKTDNKDEIKNKENQEK